MGFLSLEHSRTAYVADFALYAAGVTALSAYLLVEASPAQATEVAACVASGLASWTAIEYGLHRFVLHHVEPFSRWHAAHHARPTALICTPTVLSATLFVLLVFMPMLMLSGPWRACAVTLGMLAGYLAYAVTHHAIHHWRADGTWLARRKLWHARHHHAATPAGSYGVTSAFWDHMFGSATKGSVTPLS